MSKRIAFMLVVLIALVVICPCGQRLVLKDIETNEMIHFPIGVGKSFEIEAMHSVSQSLIATTLRVDQDFRIRVETVKFDEQGGAGTPDQLANIERDAQGFIGSIDATYNSIEIIVTEESQTKLFVDESVYDLSEDIDEAVFYQLYIMDNSLWNRWFGM